jgi:hypothetical protein
VASPETWRTLVLVYRAVDARWPPGRLPLGRRPVRRAMEPGELDATLSVVRRMPAAVRDWSDGNAAVDPFDVHVVERPIASLSDSGGGRAWVAPGDCRPELDRLASPGSRDAVLVVWPSDRRLELCGWGCSIGPGDEANGAGFSSIVSDHWRSWATAPNPEEGFVHEWLHQVEATYRGLGFDEDVFPPLHDAEILTSWRPATEPPHGDTYRVEHDRNGNTWQPWYHDYLTGRIRRPDGSGSFGLTPEVLATRSPTEARSDP